MHLYYHADVRGKASPQYFVDLRKLPHLSHNCRFGPYASSTHTTHNTQNADRRQALERHTGVRQRQRM